MSATGVGFIEWSWSPVEGAEGYQVQFREDVAFTDDEPVVERTAEETSYRREDVAPGRRRICTGAGHAGDG